MKRFAVVFTLMILISTLFSQGISEHIILALKAENRNDFALAIKHYQALLKTPLDKLAKIEVLNNIGVLYFKLKKFKKASQVFIRCLKLDNSDAKLWNNLGLCFYKTGKTNKAKLAYEKAININERFFDAYMNLANLYFNLKKFKNALKISKKILKLNPVAPEVLYGIGKIFIKLNKVKKAIFYFEAALSTKNTYEPSLLELASLYFDRGEHNNFIRVAKTLIEIQPQDEILVALGYVYYNRRQYNCAEDYLKKALFLSPQNKQALSILEKLYNKTRNYSKAAQTRKRLITLGINDFNSLTKLAIFHQKAGNYIEAIRYYERLIIKSPDNALILNNLAIANIALGKYSHALKSLRKAKKSKITNINLGWTYLRLKKYLKAVKIFKKLYKKYPLDLKVKENYSLALIYSGDFQTALKILKKLHKKYTSAHVSLYLSWLYAKKGIKKLSLYYLEQALNLDTEGELNFITDFKQEPAFSLMLRYSETKIIIKRHFTTAHL